MEWVSPWAARARVGAARARAREARARANIWVGEHVNPDWRNPEYDPDRNANGYTRFDYSLYGSGLEQRETFASAVPMAEQYFALRSNQPGYDHAQRAKEILQRDFGVNDWRQATDRQLFEAFDLRFREVQKGNQIEHNPLGGLIGPLLGVAASFIPGVGPIAAGAIGGGFGSLASGGSLTDVLTDAALGGAGGFVGSKVGSFFRGGLGGSGEAFTNPSALGLSATDLYNPASLAGDVIAGASNGLGLNPSHFINTASQLGLSSIGDLGQSGTDAWRGVTRNAGGGFTNPGAFGNGLPEAATDTTSLLKILGGVSDVVSASRAPVQQQVVNESTQRVQGVPEFSPLLQTLNTGGELPASALTFLTPTAGSGGYGNDLKLSVYRNQVARAA